MKVILIPSATAGDGSRQTGDGEARAPSSARRPAVAYPAGQFLTSFIVNDCVAFDAGSLGFYGEPAEQARVRDIFVSHSHIDHLASLPAFLENIAGLSEAPPVVHASKAVQQSLRSDMFNGRLWPDFLRLTYNKNTPFLVLDTIKSGQTVEVAGLRVTCVGVNHVVPTLGFIIEDDTSAVVIAMDTAATEEIWKRANATPNLKAVFLEATFPDEMASLAQVSLHLTPASFVTEMRKLERTVPFHAVHLKAQYRKKVVEQLLAHGLPNVSIARIGIPYEF